MKNPFNPGSGVPPPYLAGREEHIQKFSQLMEDAKNGHIENVLVSGLRGTGKTVLLDEFQRICVEKRFLPVRRSQFSEKYSESKQFEMALKYDIRVSIETFSRFSGLKRGFRTAISLLKPKSIGVPNVFYYEPSYESNKDVPFENYLEDYLDKNWSIFEAAGYSGVVFLYDEFHTVVDKKSDGDYVLSDLLAALNEVQRKGQKYLAVLTGLPNLRLNVKKARSYSERMFTNIVVMNLDGDQAKLAIEKPLKGSGYRFDAELIDALVHDTEGYPYFIQFYGKELTTSAISPKLGIEDFNRLRPSITKELDTSFFEPRFELASTQEQGVLCAMSKANGVDIPFEFIRKASHKNRGAVIRSLNRLEKKGVTYNYKRGIYRFSIPMFRSYLKRKCT